jgi:bacteriorhodopsin
MTSIWGISEGAHIVSVDTEIIAYAILDVLAKPVSHALFASLPFLTLCRSLASGFSSPMTAWPARE